MTRLDSWQDQQAAKRAAAVAAGRLCRFCGGGVEADPVKYPETDFCRNCYYNGARHGETFAELIAALPYGTSVWHTGGGCFCIAVTLADGRKILISESEDYGDGVWGPCATLPPDVDGPWAAGLYRGGEDEDYCEAIGQFAKGTRAELLAWIGEQA